MASNIREDWRFGGEYSAALDGVRVTKESSADGAPPLYPELDAHQLPALA